PEGTVRLDAATQGFLFPAYGQLTSAGSRVFFTAYDDFAGWALWTTEGTAATTVRVRGLATAPEAAAAAGNGLFFFIAPADADRTTFQLWRSDGTAPGTFVIT